MGKKGDKKCSAEIPPGTSGFCECSGGRHAREVSCDHRPFTCAMSCQQLAQFTCVAWRQTGQCSADGPREEQKDLSCDQRIAPDNSGFCECGGGRIVRKPGCSAGDELEPFTCQEECRREETLYDVLGIDYNANDRDIKQAFRKLSLKYHPDKTRNDPESSTKFSEIREAYDIIGNSEMRAVYDSAGFQAVHEAKGKKIEKGPAMVGEIGVSLSGLYNGQELTTTIQVKVICPRCEGSKSARCRACNAGCANEKTTVQVQMGPFVTQQTQEVASKQKCKMKTVPFTFSVERGMAKGDSVTFPGMGEQRPKMIPGDVILKVGDAKDAVFTRAGNDLHVEIKISLKEALLGFEHIITHLDQRELRLTVTEVTKPNQIIKIHNEGMPFKGDPTQHGDLFVKCVIVMPQTASLSPGQREWLANNFPE